MDEIEIEPVVAAQNQPEVEASSVTARETETGLNEPTEKEESDKEKPKTKEKKRRFGAKTAGQVAAKLKEERRKEDKITFSWTIALGVVGLVKLIFLVSMIIVLALSLSNFHYQRPITMIDRAQSRPFSHTSCIFGLVISIVGVVHEICGFTICYYRRRVLSLIYGNGAIILLLFMLVLLCLFSNFLFTGCLYTQRIMTNDKLNNYWHTNANQSTVDEAQRLFKCCRLNGWKKKECHQTTCFVPNSCCKEKNMNCSDGTDSNLIHTDGCGKKMTSFLCTFGVFCCVVVFALSALEMASVVMSILA